MKEIDTNNLPKNPIEAQGMLFKSIYEKFGKEALPIIKDICRKQGCSLGLKIKKKVPNHKLSTVATAFSKSFDAKYVKVIEITDEKFQIQGTKCPFKIENTSRELCEAVMEIDSQYFRTAVDENVHMTIIKTIAEGDLYCDTLYELKKK